MIMSASLVIVLTLSLFKANQISANHFSNGRSQDISKMLKDIIDNERVPSILWAKLDCWHKSAEIDLIRSISIPIQIVKSSGPISLPFDENTNKQWFYIDMACKGSSHFLANVDGKYFAHPYRWVIVGASTDSIQSLTLLPDSNVILANQDSISSKYILKQVYKIAVHTSFIYEDFGEWSNRGGLIDRRSTRILSRRRRNLKQHQLKVAAIFPRSGSENFTDLDDIRHNRVDLRPKITLEITKEWIKSVNATMKLHIHKEKGQGNSTTTEVATGLIYKLIRKKADISAKLLFISLEFVDRIEFVSVVMNPNVYFIMRAPPISYVSNIFALPFSGSVWICSISVIILCTCVVALTLSFHLNSSNENVEISEYLLLAVALTTLKGSNIPNDTLSTRISMFWFYIITLFIYISFTAHITALLQSTTKSINEISDLLRPDIGVGVEDTIFNRYSFPKTNEPYRKQLFETKIQPPDGTNAYMNLTYGMSRVRDGMFAFHMNSELAYEEIKSTFQENEKCGLIEIKFFYMADTWWVIQKHSPYKEILKVNIMQIHEHGIQTKERNRFHNERPKCHTSGKLYGSVHIHDCSPLFCILAYGTLFALLILCAEKITKTKVFLDFKNKRLQRTQR